MRNIALALAAILATFGLVFVVMIVIMSGSRPAHVLALPALMAIGFFAAAAALYWLDLVAVRLTEIRDALRPKT